MYKSIIYSNIMPWNIIEETSGHVGTRTCVAGPSQQTCYALGHHASPKKDASSPERQCCLKLWA